jgi:hypothetical protein
VPHALFLGLTLTLGASACAGEDGGGRAADASSAAIGIGLDSVPFFDVASEDGTGEPVIVKVGSAVRLSSGTVAVADAGAQSIRFFGPDRRLVRSAGRAGGGPGEYADVSVLRQCAPDTLFVWDAMQSRLTLLDSTGALVRSFTYARPPAFFHCSRQSAFALQMPVAHVGRPDPSGVVPRLHSPLLLADVGGDSVGSLGVLPLGENRPLGRVTKVALGGDRIYVGTADSAWVDVYASDGRRIRAIEVGAPPRAPSTADYERAIDEMLAPFPDPGDRRRMKERLLEVPMPERMPPYVGLFADPDGTLWVDVSAPGDTLTTLRVFQRDGRALGTVRLPVRLKVFEVARDYVLGAYGSGDGQEHVVAYRVRRGA